MYKIEVKYYEEASDLILILLNNGYKNVFINIKENYPNKDTYIITYDEYEVNKDV
jgi:hypothetical protein